MAKEAELDLVLAARAVSRDPAMIVPVMTEEFTKLSGSNPNEEIPWFIGEGPRSNLPNKVPPISLCLSLSPTSPTSHWVIAVGV